MGTNKSAIEFADWIFVMIGLGWLDTIKDPRRSSHERWIWQPRGRKTLLLTTKSLYELYLKRA